MSALPLAWGVTGSVGFTLASGIDVLRDDSDLDLLVRAPSPADAAPLREIAAMLRARAARVDVQVETPAGAFALLEWSRTGGRVLLKTALGPVLSDDAVVPAGAQGRGVSTLFTFPGQGAQRAGMLHELPHDAIVRDAIDEACDTLGLRCPRPRQRGGAALVRAPASCACWWPAWPWRGI